MTTDKPFHGDKKLPLKSPLAKVERRFIDTWVPRFPRWIEGYHLTLATLLWSAGAIAAGYLAQRDIRWLWLASGMLFMQWFTDSFDGSLGRYRDTGIPKWGFYMDHFLDFVFMSAVLIGYAILFKGRSRAIFFILVPIYGAFMVNSFLSFAATNEFKITFLGIGPTETRLLLIVLNTIILFFGTAPVERLLPAVPVFAILVLAVVVYRTQRYIWKLDMEDKRRRLEGDTSRASPRE